MIKLLAILLSSLLLCSSAFGQEAIPCSKYSFGGLAGTVQTVKSSTAILCGYHILNTSGATCYLQMFDTAATPTLGTTVPDQSLGFPSGSAANVSAVQPGVSFLTALKLAGTTTRTGSTPCTLDVNIWYK